MNKLKKTVHILLSLLLVVAASSYFFEGRAAASTNGILDTRSIQMSSSVGGQNFVQYKVTFNYGTAPNQTLGGLVIDFCQEDPLPGDACTTPTGLDVNKSTNAIASQTGVTGWAIDTTDSTTRTLILTRTPSSVTNGTTQVLTLGNGTSTGFHNPTAVNKSFYARIYTYSVNTGYNTWTSTNPVAGGSTNSTDFGGIALTTTATLTITARVEEQITLCIYTAATCAAQVGNAAITLGDSNGILDVSKSYTDISTHFDASTNAQTGMNIYAKGTTLTNPQGATIAPIGATSTASSTGNEQFGFCIFKSGGSVAPVALYGDAACSSVTTGQNSAGAAKFAFDSTNLGSLTGQSIAGTTTPTTTTTGTLAFLANISPTTKPGIYTTTMTFIGVGNY